MGDFHIRLAPSFFWILKLFGKPNLPLSPSPWGTCESLVKSQKSCGFSSRFDCKNNTCFTTTYSFFFSHKFCQAWKWYFVFCFCIFLVFLIKLKNCSCIHCLFYRFPNSFNRIWAGLFLLLGRLGRGGIWSPTIISLLSCLFQWNLAEILNMQCSINLGITWFHMLDDVIIMSLTCCFYLLFYCCFLFSLAFLKKLQLRKLFKMKDGRIYCMESSLF